MTKLCGTIAVAALALAGCGGDTCTSNPAAVKNASPSCSGLAPGQQVTFTVALNCKCTDTSPSCQAEFTSGGIEVAPVFQQCQANAGCDIPGCGITQPTATCSVILPASASGSVPLTVVGETTVVGTATIGGGNTNCSI